MNKKIFLAGILWGFGLLNLYSFITYGPDLTTDTYHKSLESYGSAYLFLSIPLVLSPLLTSIFSKRYSFFQLAFVAFLCVCIGLASFLYAYEQNSLPYTALFFFAAFLYLSAPILSICALSLASRVGSDHAVASGVTSFFCFATIIVSLEIVGALSLTNLHSLILLFSISFFGVASSQVLLFFLSKKEKN